MSIRAIVLAGALVLFALALIADYAWGNTINLPIVSQSKREPTITPFVSVGGPWIAPTQTPTVTPPPMEAP